MKFYSSCLALFLAFSFLSQSSIEFNFNEVYIGSNLGVNWKRNYPNLSFSTGLTYHINRIDQIPIGTFIKNSAFAQNFGQRFGLQLGFEYYLYKNDFFKIGLFYSNQISLMNQLIKVYSAYDTLVSNPQSEFDFLYTKYERIYGPVFTSDNVIGITLKNNITKNIYLSTRGCLGILFWKNTDNSLLLIGGNKNNQSYNFTSFFSIGIGYTFNKKEK
ncbi:MAG: hypothetical protein ACK444_11465 [Flavobacteriales bacterium]|jgi:hypothetical protein